MAGKVYPRTAQSAMRHSTIDLTMNTYTDPKLSDVAGAMESLPSLPIGPEDRQSDSARIAVRRAAEMDIPGKRWQAPFVRSTRRAVPAKGACHLFPKAVNLFLPLA